MRWCSLVVLACCKRNTPPHLVDQPQPRSDSRAIVDAAPLQPTRHLPGPCVERIAWGGNPADRGIERHTYDANGRLTQSDFDGDNDGKVTQRVRYRYPSGDRVVIESDSKADGTIDRTTEAEYTDNAALWANECTEATAHCERDGHGNILGITSDAGDRIELDYSCWP